MTMYRDVHGVPMQYTHLQGHERSLTWVRVCRNETQELDGGHPDCDWYTAGQAECTYKTTGGAGGGEEDGEAVEQEVIPINDNNCEIPHLHAMNHSRFYARIHHPEAYYGRLLEYEENDEGEVRAIGTISAAANHRRSRNATAGAGGALVSRSAKRKIAWNPDRDLSLYPPPFREAFDYAHFGGGQDTLIRQLFYCPGGAPLAVLLLPKAGSSSGQRFVWDYESARLKDAVRQEFARKKVRLNEDERFKEAFEDYQREQEEKKERARALGTDEYSESTFNRGTAKLLDTATILEKTKQNPAYSGQLSGARSEDGKNTQLGSFSRAQVAKMKADKRLPPQSLQSFLTNRDYRTRFNTQNRPYLDDPRSLQQDLVYGLPRCPLCCRDQKWRRRVVIARNPFVRFVSAFFYLLRQALLRTDVGLPKTSYWLPVGVNLLINPDAYMPNSKCPNYPDINDLSEVDLDPDLDCPRAYRAHMLTSLPDLFQRWVKIVLGWRQAYGNKGFVQNLGRFTTDEAHDILHLRPAVDIMTDPWLSARSLDKREAGEHFPPLPPTSSSSVSDAVFYDPRQAETVASMQTAKSGFFVIHLEHKDADVSKLHDQVLCGEYGMEQYCRHDRRNGGEGGGGGPKQKKVNKVKHLPPDDEMIQRALAVAKESRHKYQRSMQAFSLEFISGCRWSGSAAAFVAPGCSPRSTLPLRCACGDLKWQALWSDDVQELFLRHYEQDLEILGYKKNYEDLAPIDHEVVAPRSVSAGI
eukprot:g17391.t1